MDARERSSGGLFGFVRRLPSGECAKLLVAATLVLIFAGGLVKSTETGLSDRTWPYFNGSYAPTLHGATRFEHPHRLIAGTVAFFTYGLAAVILLVERRRSVRLLAGAAAFLVTAQALLGGLTVLFRLESLGISLAHAGTAELFLCSTVALATVMSRRWPRDMSPESEPPHALGRAELGRSMSTAVAEPDRTLMRLAAFTTIATYVQILLGAWVRYTPGAPYAIPDFPLAYGMLVPPLGPLTIRVQFIHRVGALVVAALGLATAVRVFMRHRHEPLLRRPAILLLALIAGQIALGAATVLTVKEVIPTTLHVGTGAALLATSLVLTLRSRVISARLRSGSTGKPRLREDLATLMKARIAFLVLAATAAGYYLASGDSVNVARLGLALAGTGLLAAASATLNQLIERRDDALMERTASRPIPAGRISARSAVLLGLGLSLSGLAVLAFVNSLTVLLGAATLVSYVCVYTPLKRVSWVSTVVGAVPGALPPVMGWAAARAELSFEAWILFAIIFFWQLPHFFAIAWVYRDDYRRGGFPMLPVLDRDGFATARQVILCCAALLPLSALPTIRGLAGDGYLFGAFGLSAVFLLLGLMLALKRSEPMARRLFVGSVIYLPLLLGLMVLDKQSYP